MVVDLRCINSLDGHFLIKNLLYDSECLYLGLNSTRYGNKNI